MTSNMLHYPQWSEVMHEKKTINHGIKDCFVFDLIWEIMHDKENYYPGVIGRLGFVLFLT